MNKDFEETIDMSHDSDYSTPKFDRIVWGMGIGGDSPHKTVEDAFVGKLFSIMLNLDQPNATAPKEQTEKELQDFKNNWQNDPNLSEAEKNSLLGVAYVKAREKRSKYMLASTKYHNEYNQWDIVKSGILPKKEAISNVDSEIARHYNQVCNVIEDLQNSLEK